MNDIQVVETSKAPAAIGPYSQAVRVSSFLFCSGQIPIDPATQAVVEGKIIEQTERVCLNIRALLESQGLGLERVVKTTCFLKNMSDFSDFNQVYQKYFSQSKPARSTVEVARLPKDVLVEIEVIASY